MNNKAVRETAMAIWRAHGGKLDMHVAKLISKAASRLHRHRVSPRVVMEWASNQPHTRTEYT